MVAAVVIPIGKQSENPKRSDLVVILSRGCQAQAGSVRDFVRFGSPGGREIAD